MSIEHIAIWTNNLEEMCAYYEQFFGGTPNSKYINPQTGFESYFLAFETGARLELMRKPNLPANQNDLVGEQHLGIIHIAFSLPTRVEVDKKAKELQEAGFAVLREPRITGDGYYEFETVDYDGNRLEVVALS